MSITTIYTKEKCGEIASNYKNKTEFKANSSRAYEISRKNGWFDLCSHMIHKHKLNNYWSFERCEIEAKIFSTRNKFKLGSGSAYQACLRNKWLDIFFK